MTVSTTTVITMVMTLVMTMTFGTRNLHLIHLLVFHTLKVRRSILEKKKVMEDTIYYMI
ncbi:hypothetical protein EDD57_15914 [Baia soyae]|uniref:Uncharacterized protein n=1 Tax=Baia soyae TaxID=1544746 RepID=A0A4R2RHZ2_9BACL|nr:hypothetical protein EDD57_15914 [Baia soyae]